LWHSIHDHLILPVTSILLPATISGLWLPNSRSWNTDLIANVFYNQAIQAITNIQPVHSDHRDILRWTPSKNGQCTTKSVYRYFNQQQLVQLPQQGSRSVQPQANNTLQRAWKTKQLSPLIKAFTWRLIRRALAIADCAARYSTHIDKHCADCSAVEDDAHLFFHCQLPRAVWFSMDPPL
jgi:hypothetical protein